MRLHVRRSCYDHMPSTARQSITTVTTFLEIDSNTEAGRQFLQEYSQNMYNESLEEQSKSKLYWNICLCINFGYIFCVHYKAVIVFIFLYNNIPIYDLIHYFLITKRIPLNTFLRKSSIRLIIIYLFMAQTRSTNSIKRDMLITTMFRGEEDDYSLKKKSHHFMNHI